MHNLRKVNLYANPVTDKCLPSFVNLPLTYLSVSSTKISDAGMETVSKIQTLRWLDISETNIGGKGLRSIVNLPKLENLDADNTKMTSADLTWLKQCKSLRMLNLSVCKIDDSDGAVLADLPLLALYVSDCNLSDSFLSKLRQSKTLRIPGHRINPRITEKGLQKLKNLPLRGLWIQKTEATKDGHLECLDGIKTLQTLQVGKTPPGTAQRLHAKHPHCEILTEEAKSFNPDATVRSLEHSDLRWP